MNNQSSPANQTQQLVRMLCAVARALGFAAPQESDVGWQMMTQIEFTQRNGFRLSATVASWRGLIWVEVGNLEGGIRCLYGVSDPAKVLPRVVECALRAHAVEWPTDNAGQKFDASRVVEWVTSDPGLRAAIDQELLAGA